MKTYNDLDLMAICEACNLDFAHYTYMPRQCSCCYTPLDMPAKYWRNGKKPVTRSQTKFERIREKVGASVCMQYTKRDKAGNVVNIGGCYQTNYSYLLFNNANNGSGIVSAQDTIGDLVFINWSMSMAQLEQVCRLLSKQLGTEYFVFQPPEHLYAIQIATSSGLHSRSEHLRVEPAAVYNNGILVDRKEIKPYE